MQVPKIRGGAGSAPPALSIHGNLFVRAPVANGHFSFHLAALSKPSPASDPVPVCREPRTGITRCSPVGCTCVAIGEASYTCPCAVLLTLPLFGTAELTVKGRKVKSSLAGRRPKDPAAATEAAVHYLQQLSSRKTDRRVAEKVRSLSVV